MSHVPRHKVIAKVLIINDEGEVLCMTRSRHDDNRPGGWDFPGGDVEQDETIEEGLKREALEEAGIQLHNPQLVYTMSDSRHWGVGNWLFFVEHTEGRPEVRMSRDHEVFEWLAPDALLEKSDYELHHELINFITRHHLI